VWFARRFGLQLGEARQEMLTIFTARRALERRQAISMRNSIFP
jgi:hypothetical protein